MDSCDRAVQQVRTTDICLGVIIFAAVQEESAVRIIQAVSSWQGLLGLRPKFCPYPTCTEEAWVCFHLNCPDEALSLWLGFTSVQVHSWCSHSTTGQSNPNNTHPSALNPLLHLLPFFIIALHFFHPAHTLAFPDNFCTWFSYWCTSRISSP